MNHPDNKGKPKLPSDDLWRDQASAVNLWNTPLIENEEIVELPVDQRTVTRRYTDRAIEFVKENRDRPFFLYLPHTMPHIPLYVPEDVYDPDPQNAYTCVIEHIDAEVGRLMDTIRQLDANGPWRDPIVTKVEPLDRFFPAEAYHDKYFKFNPLQPYCRTVIDPKVQKFRKRFDHLIVPTA